MIQIFNFKQENRINWDSIITKLNQTIFAVKKQFKKDFEIEIREKKKKRSGQQLKAYWILITAVQNWMNQHGNCYSKEEVSSYFKIKSGHYAVFPNDNKNLEWQYIPKSIANKSDCTIEQMEKLIKIILVFGAENLIEDCRIEDRDLQELLNYYK